MLIFGRAVRIIDVFNVTPLNVCSCGTPVLVVTDSHPIHDEDTKLINFEGVTIELTNSDIGYIMDKENVALCTLENIMTLDKIISSNKELFDGHILTINGKEFMDRFAIASYLMKVNGDKIHPTKRNMLVMFQKSVIEAMVDSHLRARLHVTNDHRITINHNLRGILDLHKEDVDEMLIDLEYQMSKLFMTQSTQLSVCDRKMSNLERENNQLKTRVEVELKAKNRLITEVRECQGKLLDRS